MEHMRHPGEIEHRRGMLEAALTELKNQGLTAPDTEEAMEHLQTPGDTLQDPEGAWTITMAQDGGFETSF